jgi:hypothetical protein
MAQEILIADIVDLTGNKKDLDTLISYINNVDAAIEKVNKNPLNLGNVNGLKELKQATEQLLAATQQLTKAVDDTVKINKSSNDTSLNSAKIKTEEAKQSKELAKAENELAKAKTEQAKASTEASKEQLNKSRTGKENAQASKAEAQADKELAASKKIIAQTEKELAQAKKIEAQSIKELYAAERLEAQATKEGNAAKKLEAQTAKEVAQTKLIEAKTSVEVLKVKQLENKEREAATKAVAAEQKAIDQIANEYLQLSKAYNESALKAKNYAITLGENHPITIQAVKDAKDLGDFLKRIDASVGQNQRNVGNYSSAFEGLRFQMSQLLRETPALAINLQTFFLALSNNLPLFFDAVQKAKKANNDLAASGGKPVPIFQQLVKGLFSLNSILTIGVTLLTLYGSKIIDWVETLFKGEDGTKKINRQINEFNKTIEESAKKLQRLEDNLQFLQKLGRINIDIQGLNIPQIGKLKGDLDDIRALSIDQITKTNDLEKAEQKLQATRSKAYETFLNSLKDSDKELLDSNGGFDSVEFMSDKLSENAKNTYNAYVKVNEALTQTQEKLNGSQDAQRIIFRQIALQKGEIDKEQATQTRKLILESINAEVDIRKRAADSVLNNDKSSLDQRLAALRSYLSAEKATIAAQKNDVFSNPESSPEERKIATEKANAASFSANKDYEEKAFRLKEDYRIRDIQAEKDAFIQKKQLQADQLNDLSNNSEFNLNDRLSFQQAAFDAQKAIIDKEHQAQLESVKNKDLTNQEKLAIEVDYETKLLELVRKTQSEATEILKSELDKQQSLRDQDFDNIERTYSRFFLSSDSQYSQDVIALNNALKSKTVSYEQYLKKRKSLDNAYSEDVIKNTIREVQQELSLYEGAETSLLAVQGNLLRLREKLNSTTDVGEQEQITKQIDVEEKKYDIAKKNVDKKIDLEKKLNDATKNYSDDTTKHEAENAEKRRENLARVLGQLAQFVQEISQFGASIIDRRIQAIEAEKDALEERYAREQELIKVTYTNQIDQQTKLAEADARYRARKVQLEKQEKEEKIKQARFEKAASIASIILNTAAAVVKALPNIPLAVASGVIGAAQLSVAVATPLPKFYKGKNVDATDKYEGLAWVDDGGKPELIVREDGSMEVGTNKPRVTYLSKDDIVFPDAKEAIKEINNNTHSDTKTFNKETKEKNSHSIIYNKIKEHRVEKPVVMPDIKLVAWNATATAAKPQSFTVNNSFDSGEIVSELKLNNRLLKAIKNKPTIKFSGKSPLDDWMNGGISTNDLFK